MYRSLLIALVVSVCAFSVSAQSGRRGTATPTPVSVTSDDPSQYSESKPQTRRIGRPAAQPPVLIKPAEDAAANADDGEVLRVTTDLITIPVSVFDRNGLYIPGLRQSDFKIFEDGREQEIAYFGASDKPFTVALVLDVSLSTAYRIEEIRRAATAFVDQLQSQDSVIVIDFDSDVHVRTSATRDRMRIYNAINKANFGGGTSLYNAVDEALRKQLGKIEGRKAVVLFTDGVDTTSRKNSYDSTLNYAEEMDALIFPIYYNTYFDNRRNQPGGMPRGGGILGTILGGGNSGGVIWPSAEDYALGRRYLEELADATGGRVFRPEATPGGLTAAFEGIAEELRRQYNIGYVPTHQGKIGQRKQIRVRVNRPNLILRARDSYVVGSAPTTPIPTSTPIK
jgi:VWFA-related protein